MRRNWLPFNLDSPQWVKSLTAPLTFPAPQHRLSVFDLQIMLELLRLQALHAAGEAWGSGEPGVVVFRLLTTVSSHSPTSPPCSLVQVAHGRLGTLLSHLRCWDPDPRCALPALRGAPRPL